MAFVGYPISLYARKMRLAIQLRQRVGTGESAVPLEELERPARMTGGGRSETTIGGLT
jgi:hypothetical protein